MAKRRRYQEEPAIVLKAGSPFCKGLNCFVELKAVRHMITINDRLIIPFFRRINKKKVYIDDKFVGTISRRDGCCPLADYMFTTDDPAYKFRNFMRRAFGIGCSQREKNWYLAKLNGHSFIIQVDYCVEGYWVGFVYDKESSRLMCSFFFDENITKVQYGKLGQLRDSRMLAIIEYIAQELAQMSCYRLVDRVIKFNPY